MRIPLTRRLFYYYLRDALFYWVILPGAYLGGGWLVQKLVGLPPLPDRGWIKAAGTILSAFGIGIIVGAMYHLWRYGEGTPNPKAPPRRLVTRGLYGWVRHPMFLGYDLCALGVGLFFRLSGALLVALPLFFLWEVRFLKREERRLARRFGKEFENYAKKVPFLLPFPWRIP